MSRTDKAPTPAPAAAPARRGPAGGPRGLPAAQTPMRIPRPAGGPGRGGPFAGMNIPAEKAMNFGRPPSGCWGSCGPNGCG